MNKYYTPTVDELYVGFECEFFNNQQDKVWNKEICDEDLVSIAYTIYEHGTIEWEDDITRVFRVKYLDKEDIEELGFVLEYIPNCYTEDDEIQLGHSLRIDEDTSILLHCIFSKNTLKDGVLTPCNIIQVGITRQHVYNKNTGNWEITHLFLGEIKNKSELKKLLKQLGIE
jgi:hypothetical protein